MLFHSHPWNKTQVVPLALSLSDMPAVPVFRSAASVEDMRVGTEGLLDDPSSAKESSQRTKSKWSKCETYCANNLWLDSVHLKLRWNTWSFPSWRDFSLNSLAYCMCTMFHTDSRFSEPCLYINSNSFRNIDLRREKDALDALIMWCSVVFCYITQTLHSYQTNIRNLCKI